MISQTFLSSGRTFKVMFCVLSLWILEMQADEVSGVLQVSNPRIVEHPEDLYVGRNEPATLNCKVEGEPTPLVTWYRDSQLVVTANDSPASHRMLLPNGQLFFLRVVRSKTGDSDIGVYYCNATNPETKVSVISRNASLKIAVMRDEFRELPQNTEVGSGMDVTLVCKPPRGEPEPRVRWLRGDQVVQPDDRMTIDDQGSLIIREARKEDAGVYVCMAYNVGGEKESPPAQLFVREKPVIVEGPKDTVAQENSDVILQCQASGDPEPVIIWKKIEGQIPAERSQILVDRSLKIHNAQVTDEGTYVCRLENSVGWQEAEARLAVHSRPSFLVTPRDKVVGAGRRVSIRCEVTGNPLPAVFWNKASSQTFMFPNQDHGRFRVTAEGSLVIENVQKEDAGEYTCQGLSMAGSAYAKARLDVKDSDTRPPPIIHQGPQNQTLPITGTALLSCLATGDPPPAIHWLKNGVNLSLRESRFNIRESGSLEISDLRRSDTGIYTCKAMSETGETAWSAALVVESTDNPSIIFHRTPEPSTFPGPPTKPIVSDVTETSVRLSWKLNINQGASPVNSFSVEYFSHDTGEGWVMASEDIKEQTYIVRNLLPNTSYLFLVRAKNSHGLSLPSPVTSPVRTKGESLPLHPMPTPCTEPGVMEKLSGQVVHMLPQEVLSSTTVKLNWELRKNLLRHVAGYHLKYRVAQDLDDHSSSARQPQADYIIRTVQSPTLVTHVLSGLQKYTWYEAMILPFCGTFEGTESNTIRFRTLEDVPSAAPRNIRVTVLENDTLLVSWEPPPKHFRNGLLKGYHIYLQGNESKFDRIVDVNFSFESVQVRHLVRDMPYRLQMAAYNRMGEGVKSETIILGHSGAEVDDPIFSQQWFRITIIATVGVILWIFFCILSICIYRKRRALLKVNKKNAKCHDDSLGSCQKSGELASQIPLIAGKGNRDTSLAPSMIGQPCVATCCCENESPSDGDSKTNGSLSHGHTYQTQSVHNLDRPYQCDSSYGGTGSMQCYSQTTPAVPYATATLVCGAPYHAVCGTGNIPNPQAYMIHQPNAKHDSKNESSSSNFSESGNRIPASVSMPMNPDASHRAMPESDKGCDAPHYEYVMYNNRMCNIENPDKHVGFGKNERGCDDSYSGIEPSRCFTPESATTDSDAQDGSQATWPTDNESISNCSSVSSCGADADSFIGEIDFASAITKAAELSGLSVVGSTVSPLVPDNHKVRKHSRSRQRANRPASPYSTDSNYSHLPTQHKPYPKADRRKQIGEQQDDAQSRRPTNQSASLQIDDIPLKKSAVPYSAANSSGRGKLPTTVNSLAHSRNPEISTQANPVTAFDTRKTNMV